MTGTQPKASPHPARTDAGASRAAPARLKRLALAVALFGLLYSFYLLTYSGVFNSDDERYILDTTESIVRHRTLFLNQTTYIRPLQTSSVEPAQPFLTVPLYFLADHLDSVGNVQTTFLFNPIITALTAVLLFAFALDLGYGHREALLAGALFGLGTIAWPYTKTLFREPLAAFTLLASLFCLQRWRAGLERGEEDRPTGWLAFGLGAFLISAYTKEAALIAAPLVMLYALPSFAASRIHWRAVLILGASVLGVGIVFALMLSVFQSQNALAGRYAILTRLSSALDDPLDLTGLTGFLFSPGKSVFVFSPVALLALGGLFVRHPEDRRERWLALGMLLTFVVVYTVERGPLWHGGSGWGPRYLVPLTPLLVLGGLPVLKWAFDTPGLWPRVALALLAMLSVAAQVPGLLINAHHYYNVLLPLGRGAPWNLGIWEVKYSQVWGHLGLIGRIPLDLAWVRPATDWLAIGILLAGGLVCGALLIWLTTRPGSRRQAGLAVAGGVVLVVALSAFALRRLYDDPYFNGDQPPLHELLNYLDENVAPGDAILLSNARYVNFFANYYKGDAWWFSMPRSPGERHSEDEVPLVESDNPEALVSERAKELMTFTPAYFPYQSLWLVVDGGPFTPWHPRPPEWWAAERYYTVHTEEFAPTVRLVEYLSYPAPDPDAPPVHERAEQIGESIALAGYDLHRYQYEEAITFRPGDQLGLSLVWRAETVPPEDYIAAVFLIGPDGQLVSQQDRTPVASFRPTSTWQPGQTLRDNYGFILPPDLPPGRYQLWVAMYRWPSLERLPVTSASGENLGDHTVVTEFDVVD